MYPILKGRGFGDGGEMRWSVARLCQQQSQVASRGIFGP